MLALATKHGGVRLKALCRTSLAKLFSGEGIPARLRRASWPEEGANSRWLESGKMTGPKHAFLIHACVGNSRPPAAGKLANPRR